ncbi:MAG: tRNA (adenosine(37)-N6)-threonylcarbamoyltransferase complex ATPase subunit type 1 TsaE [Nitrospirae bacterium]|nr:tRNA (adenosine(37)-N6)-threonylcarbamoyltransferase complex ATPase subunit type 1 TsaE [Nitrospirota bacterium]MBI3595454.1 tRNA (adenosine(37)-N6)-threonylcarbamoyltransferase complex ATPase subunit type 1 TsaE [Nitrospirota bacterium]
MEWITRSEEETLSAGNQLGARLQGGEVITLSGPLGAGKTTFAKGVGQALSISPLVMTSPTFILRAEHEGRFPLAHIDLYRVDRLEEMNRLGLFDQENPLTILLIEWPEKAQEILPRERLEIKISPKGTEHRKFSLNGRGQDYSYLIFELKCHEKN